MGTKTRSKATDAGGLKNIVDTGTEGSKLAVGTTAQRGTTTGQFRWNTTTTTFEGRNADGSFTDLEPLPVITEIKPISFNGEAGTTITITGKNFVSGFTVKILGDDGTQYNSGATSFTNSTTITFVTPVLLQNNEPYSVKVINPSGTFTTFGDCLDAGGSPSWAAYPGSPSSVGSIGNTDTGNHFTLAATDADGQAITYAAQGSVWSGIGLSVSSAGVISGNPTDQGSLTTFTETIRATDAAGNYSDKALSISVGPFNGVSAGDGSDGALIVTGLSQPNTYYAITDASKASGSNTFTLDTVSGLAIGDKVLVWQVQHQTTSASAGKMIYTNITAINGSVVTTADNINWAMTSNDANNSTAHTAQIVRIPQYTTVDVNIGGVLAPGRWTGTKGGILVIEATGVVTVDSGGYIVGDGMGFRGGHGGISGSGGTGQQAQQGYPGEVYSGNGLNYGSVSNTTTGHVNLHSVTGSGSSAGVGYGGGGTASGGGGGGGGGNGGAQDSNISSNKFLPGGGGGGGGGSGSGNHSNYSRGGAGAGSGGGVIMIRCHAFLNNGITRSRPGYGAGGGAAEDYGSSAFAAAGTGSSVDVIIAGHNLGDGHGLWNTYDVAPSGSGTKATNGGAGTGLGGAYSTGSSGGNDHGGWGGVTGVVGGGNGAKGDDGGSDGGGGGGAGGSGGGGASGGHDIAGGGGGGRGGGGGLIWIEATHIHAGSDMAAPRGIGGGGGASTSGGSQCGHSGGSAQFNSASGTGYSWGASGVAQGCSGYYSMTNTGGGAAGYVGNIGFIHLASYSGTYSGTVASTDNGQAQTGASVTTATLTAASPFGNNGYSAN